MHFSCSKNSFSVQLVFCLLINTFWICPGSVWTSVLHYFNPSSCLSILFMRFSDGISGKRLFYYLVILAIQIKFAWLSFDKGLHPLLILDDALDYLVSPVGWYNHKDSEKFGFFHPWKYINILNFYIFSSVSGHFVLPWVKFSDLLTFNPALL